ncbi:hypothetical protein [Hartmannibacter diazotrophicus]|uniref:hypothetical protein n=1 Tax=Hartmannibacter diazotrophicus TaxID=1482074 RepID=UPI0012FE7CBB|nr:hypothetical protein [Hartmannibacter diazotrophicus]
MMRLPVFRAWSSSHGIRQSNDANVQTLICQIFAKIAQEKAKHWLTIEEHPSGDIVPDASVNN